MRIAIAVAAAIAATSVSFTVATATNHQPTAQTSARTDRAIVKHLRSINREVRELNQNIGSHSFAGGDSLRKDLRGYFDEANGKLDDICRNTDDRGFC